MATTTSGKAGAIRNTRARFGGAVAGRPDDRWG